MSRWDIYDELGSVARAIHGNADVRTKAFALDRMDLGTLYSLRMGSQREGNHDTAMNVGLEIIDREINNARLSNGPKPHAKVMYAFVGLFRQASFGHNAGGSARIMSVTIMTGIPSRPEWLKRYLQNAPKSPKPRDVLAMTGLNILEWNQFAALVIEANSSKTSPASAMAKAVLEPIDLNVASRLSRLARKEVRTSEALPYYDVSDTKIRINRVTVTGFRGSPGTASLDLTKNGKAADILLWGDNGVGKSTLVDGIEFALQGRVDRSADFNSSLRASVKNLTVPTAQASVELNDGSIETRTLVSNSAGRDETSDLAVRPGFRLAPIAIRRADILRFLDTDALARGTVFFDYFPDPTGSIGARPDEQLRQLEEERFLLRVARDDLAAQLADIYPGATTDFTNTDQLELFVSEEIYRIRGNGLEDSIEALPEATRKIVGQLRTAQQRGTAIKKKLDKGVETLNPKAYESQLQRIVPILQTVTNDLTTSFQKITRAKHVVAIRVLVAKTGPVSLDVVVEFDNGASALPQQAFSEGYKDLIALLFFLTVTKKAAQHGQAKVLILDDALQSVDASVRLGVMEYVLTEFHEWQLIVTGHDRAWLSQLRGLFARRGRSMIERNISSWSFEKGIEVVGASRTRAISLRDAIDRADESMTASGTGLLLEEITQEISWRLGTSVTRREGDRYTLGDLWPGVAKSLRATRLVETLSGINLRLDVRNLIGAHYNEWADSISWSDVRLLAEDVMELYTATHCSQCDDWIRKDGARLACRCGLTVL